MSLESKLKKFENNITVTTTDLELKEYNAVKQELEQIYNYITEGIIELGPTGMRRVKNRISIFLTLRRGVSLKRIFENL